MNAIGSIPFLVAALLGLTGAQLGRWLPPAAASRLLTLTSLVTALATGFILAVLALTVLAQTPAIAALGHWSHVALQQGMPLPPAFGLLPAVVVIILLAASLCRTVAVVRDLAAAQSTCRRLGAAAGGLVVLADDHPAAYTLPGVTGRIVISTAMLRALPVDERRVLLAHETSHLRHRHHLYVQLADIAAVANPLLRPVAAAVARSVERWADEDAAAIIGDRRLAARALARAGLAGAAAARPLSPVALGAVQEGVVARAHALLAPAPKRRRALSAAVVALMLGSGLAAADTARVTELRFEHAEIVHAQAM